MSDETSTQVSWRGVGLKALGAIGGGVALAIGGLFYSRIGGT